MKIIILLITIAVTGTAYTLKYIFGFNLKTELDVLSLATLAVNISLAFYISVYLSKRNQELRSQKDLIISTIRKFLDLMFAEKETLEKLANNRNREFEARIKGLEADFAAIEKEAMELTATIQKQVILTKNERNIWVSMIDNLDRRQHRRRIGEIAELSHQLTDLYIGQNERDIDNSITDFESWKLWMAENEYRYTQFVRIAIKIMYKVNAL